jgi:hypothetical protein
MTSTRSLELFEEAGHPLGQARSLLRIARRIRRDGDQVATEQALRRALDAAEAACARLEHVSILVELGDCLAQRGAVSEAVTHWRHAMALYAEVDAPEAEDVRERLRVAEGREAPSARG